MLPVRVMVINSRGDMGAPSEVIADSYAIITGSLKMRDLVATTLMPHGLGHLATASKGFIQFDNWKPISLEDITDNEDGLVVDLLKPVAHSAVLKVVVSPVRISPCSSPDVVSAPLDLSRAKVQHETTEAPLTDSETIDSGSEHGGDGSSKQLPLRNERELEDGVSTLPESVVDQPPSVDHILLQFLQQQAPLFEQPLNVNAAESQEEVLTETHSVKQRSTKMTRSPAPTKKRQRFNPMEKPEKASLVRFDPVTEVPMLQNWFVENRIPSKAQCQTFADTFNSMSYRQTNPPLSSQTVYNWFKYTRSRGPKSATHASVKTEVTD